MSKGSICKSQIELIVNPINAHSDQNPIILCQFPQQMPATTYLCCLFYPYIMKQTIITLLLLGGLCSLSAQMFVGQDTLYGNEWIDHSRTYYKISVPRDGVYRINGQAMTDAGIAVGSVPGTDWRLYHNGVQTPVFVSTEGLFFNTDFVEFWGEKNRNELDVHLSDNPDADLVNPWYSLFNDTSAYFLTWENNTPALRYTALQNNLINPPTPEPYCWWTATTTFSNAFTKRDIADEVRYSWFDGDGFSDNGNVTSNYSFTAQQPYFNGPQTATFRIRYACNRGIHQQQIFLHDSLYTEDAFSDWKIVDRTLDVGVGRLNAALPIKINGIGIGIPDRNMVAGYEVRYPGNTAFPSMPVARFGLDASANDKYLEITNVDVTGGAPVLYDLTNRVRLQTDVQNNKVLARLNSSAGARSMVLATMNQGITGVSTLKPVQFRNYAADATVDYIIISNPALYKDPQDNNSNHVAEYADYRRSVAGGSHKVTIVDVNELYEQFSFGVRFHPLAIRNFSHFIKKTWENPAFLLFIGKGLEYAAFRSSSDQNTQADKLFLVPMYGSPAVDQSFLMQRSGISRPILAVGRLAVTEPFQIKDYLQKLEEHENSQQQSAQTIEDRDWTKRIIHISGGLAAESGIISTYTKDMEQVIRNNRFGGDVHTFFKTSNDPIQSNSLEQIRTLMRDGVSMWTIFGHSSAFNVDYDIGDPAFYGNNPKYPFMMVMGCNVGACSLNQQALGEDYVFTPHSGAIAFSATPWYGFVDALHIYGRRFYERVGGDDYGKPIGIITQNTIESFVGNASATVVSLLHQNVLQGDPALVLNRNQGPDYLVDKQSVVFNPNPISTDAPTYNLSFDVANIGENISHKMAVKIEQQLPDNTLRTLQTDTITCPPLRQNLQYTIPNNNAKTGYNRFFITVDVNNEVAESPAAAEFNNELMGNSGEKGVEIYFYSNDVMPIAPQDFGIVAKSTVSLFASASGNNISNDRYLFELDTLETFNSPYLRKKEIIQSSGLLQWSQELGLKDSTVVYWRVARDSLIDGKQLWRNRSFIFLEGSKPGWNQSDFGQYKTNTLSNLATLDSIRMLDFVGNESYVMVKVDYADAQYFPGLNNDYYEGYLSGYQYGNMQNAFEGVLLMVTDPASGHVIWNPQNGPFNPNPSVRQHYFYFRTADSLQRIALMNFIDNNIPDQSAVAVLAFNREYDQVGYAPERWANDSVSFGKNLFQVFESLGAKEVRKLATYSAIPPAYGFIFRKNDPQFPAIDSIVDVPGAYVELRGAFPTRWFAGQMQSNRIGPAKAWKSLHFLPGKTDNPSDEHVITLWGERNNLTDTLLMTFSSATDTSLAAFSVADFPYLHLRYNVLDTAVRSATPLHYARILYESIPEGALHPTAKFDFFADTLQQGQPMWARIAFANVSDTGFDSLQVKFRIESQSGTTLTALRKHRPLPAGDTLQAYISFDTRNFTGPVRFLVDVNPDNAQPEWYHSNNVAFSNFFVTRDTRNPLLNITFDGRRLLDGDLISPKPEIMVTLDDENTFLAIADTSAFRLTLVLPNGDEKALTFADPDILFIPANGDHLNRKNQARIEWRPWFDQDGEYTLNVQGRDASGNISAAVDYSVRFKVINKSSISNLLNYPNPFSTSTCFYYTMTGVETPAQFKLQIMTVSGKIVREITEAEFGPLQAGVHQSQYCWNGKDEFGDQLANGIYLYRISAKKADGTPFEFFENTAVDGFFKNGFGKMVLMR